MTSFWRQNDETSKYRETETEKFMTYFDIYF